MENTFLKPNIQLFAEEGAGEGGSQQGGNQEKDVQTPQFDYEKLAGLINGKQSVTEDTVLKSYFKQQGLSQEEATKAMQMFKEQKAKEQPDVNALQQQMAQVQQIARQAELEKHGVLQAVGLNIDAAAIPHLLKLADFSAAINEEGKVDDEQVKQAIEKVLEDVPQFKPQQEQASGFKFGADSSQKQTQSSEDQLKAAFGL